MNCMTIAMQKIIYYYMNIIILLSVNYVTFDLMIFNLSDKITVDRAASHFRCSKHPVNRSTFKIVLKQHIAHSGESSSSTEPLKSTPSPLTGKMRGV